MPREWPHRKLREGETKVLGCERRAEVDDVGYDCAREHECEEHSELRPDEPNPPEAEDGCQHHVRKRGQRIGMP